MKALAPLFVVLLLRPQEPPAPQKPGGEPAPPSGCVICHVDPALVRDAALRAPVERLQDDVHAAVQLSCHDCHGGDPATMPQEPDALARAHGGEGWRGRPGRAEIPDFCGRCHADAAYMSRFVPDVRVDQMALYQTSNHGRRLAEGDDRVATCISCHGFQPEGNAQRSTAHGIRAVIDPRGPVHPYHVAATCGSCHSDAAYMEGYDLPTDQAEAYERSVHRARLVESEDLSAPTCNDCHGNHGAKPPEVESVSFVCGMCHGRQTELFRQSTMKAVFDELKMGECMVCHENHGIVSPADDMLPHGDLSRVKEGGASGAEVCFLCHDAPDDPALPTSAAMHGALVDLERDIHEARQAIHGASLKGMPVAEAEYALNGATDALIEARVQVHRFAAEPVTEVCARGREVAVQARGLGSVALREYFFRHRWLAVSLLGIAFVIVSLLLKIRQVDRRWRQAHAIE